MKHLGMGLEVGGAALMAYALYTVAPWAGLLLAGVFAVIIGIGIGDRRGPAR